MYNNNALADAEKRLKEDWKAIDRTWDIVRASYSRARRDFDATGAYPNTDVAELDRSFNATHAEIGRLGWTGSALLRAEAEVPKFADIEAKAAAKLTDHRSRCVAQAHAVSAAWRFGNSKPSRTPHLDAAIPALRQRLDALYDRVRREGYDNIRVFESALDELEGAVKTFSTSIGLERRAARQRFAKTDAAAAVAAALVAA